MRIEMSSSNWNTNNDLKFEHYEHAGCIDCGRVRGREHMDENGDDVERDNCPSVMLCPTLTFLLIEKNMFEIFMKKSLK